MRNMTRIIKDSIYGFIHLSELCKIFIDTPEFQRLRRIKQLGLAHYVYPSAVHTRFEHSLGVMHLAGVVADKLNENVNPTPRSGAPVDRLSLRVTPREKELLQIAGLLHDVGHVALSHLMDYILEEKTEQKELTLTERVLTADAIPSGASGPVRSSAGPSVDGLSHHENRSIMVLIRINDRITDPSKKLTEREVTIVSKMILGDISDEKKPFLFEIINNKAFGVDVDRLDYLQRDMYHTGSPCFQPNYILECFTVKNLRLALKRKAEPEVEMMYEARKRLLLLVCRHATVVKTEFLIRQAVEKLKITGEWFTKNWLKLDDGRLHVMMEDQCPEILDKIYRRDYGISDDDINRYDHVKYVTRETIQEQLKVVNWV